MASTYELQAPLLAVDDTHHGAWVAIAAAIGLTLTTFCLLIRVYVRVVISPPFAIDDFVLLCGTISGLIQNGLTFSMIDKGFGNSMELLNSENRNYIQKTYLASDIFYLFTLFLTKCCTIMVFFRLSPKQSHQITTWITFGLTVAWFVPSVFLISINCSLHTPWETVQGQCGSLFARWQFIVALDVITEIVLFGVAILFIAQLQMLLKKKLIVLSTFGSRLPVIVFCSVRLYKIKASLYSSNPSLDLVDTAIWTQVGLHFVIISCTSFCLKPFMAAVSTNYGVGEATTTSGSFSTGNAYAKQSSYGYSNKESQRSGNNFALKSLPGKSNTRLKGIGDSRDDEESGMFRGLGNANNLTTAVADDRRLDASSIESNDSTKLIIKKDMEYKIHYDPRPEVGESSRLGAGNPPGHKFLSTSS